jgi:hypothetical protein
MLTSSSSRLLTAFLLLLGVFVGLSRAADQQIGVSARPEPAAPALLKLFEEYRVVGLSDLHGCAELLAFLEQLVKSPEFGQTVDDITWEPGNVRYQNLMDDYILRGKDVPYASLAKCWRENTQVHTYSDTPALYHLLQTIRATNLNQPDEHKVRVLLIDPPVDWSKIKTKQDLASQDFDRESHMAKVLEREVYAKRRKALFFAGGAHLSRGGDSQPQSEAQRSEVRLPIPKDAPQIKPFRADKPEHPTKSDRDNAKAMTIRPLASPLQSLEHRHRGTTFNICIHGGFGERNDELESRLDSWPKPGLARLRGTWYGAERPASSGDVMIGPDGKRVRPSSEGKIQDRWDAVLYLGKRHELTRVSPPGKDVLDKRWLDELKRRRNIGGGPPGRLEPDKNPMPSKFFDDPGK